MENSEGPVLGCIEFDFRNQLLLLLLITNFSGVYTVFRISSCRSFCTAANSDFQQEIFELFLVQAVIVQ